MLLIYNLQSLALWAVSKTSFNTFQALAESVLCESHFKELVAGRHPFAGPGHRVHIDAAVKLFPIQQIDVSRKYQASNVHPLLRMKSLNTCQPGQMLDTAF